MKAIEKLKALINLNATEQHRGLNVTKAEKAAIDAWNADFREGIDEPYMHYVETEVVIDTAAYRFIELDDETRYMKFDATFMFDMSSENACDSAYFSIGHYFYKSQCTDYEDQLKGNKSMIQIINGLQADSVITCNHEAIRNLLASKMIHNIEWKWGGRILPGRDYQGKRAEFVLEDRITFSMKNI